MTMEEDQYTLDEANRKFAVLSNNRAWELLETDPRTSEQDAEMLLAGQASLYHWQRTGKEVNIQRAWWLLAHIHTVLGQGDAASACARTCQEWTARFPQEMKDFDLAYAMEGLARAEALAGHKEQAAEYYRLARTAGNEISDPEDMDIFERDFSGGNWYGLDPASSAGK